MQSLDDSTLIAYVDGELDAATARDVEARLRGDGALSRRVERLRAATALLRGAYNVVLHEPVPTRLVASCIPEEEEPATVTPIRARRAASRWEGWTPGLAIAATVTALAVGLSGGYIFSDWHQEGLQLASMRQQTALNEAIQQTVNNALEHQLSGTPVNWASGDDAITVKVTPLRTYKDSQGQYCREYRQEVVEQGIHQVREGLSCRTGQDQWEPKLFLNEPSRTGTSRTM